MPEELAALRNWPWVHSLGYSTLVNRKEQVFAGIREQTVLPVQFPARLGMYAKGGTCFSLITVRVSVDKCCEARESTCRPALAVRVSIQKLECILKRGHELFAQKESLHSPPLLGISAPTLCQNCVPRFESVHDYGC